MSTEFNKATSGPSGLDVIGEFLPEYARIRDGFQQNVSKTPVLRTTFL